MKNIDLYIVKAGDTLYNIAKKYQILWQDLIKLNVMNDTMLNIGKQLIVPGNADELQYSVEKGDTLNSIANKFDVSIEQIKLLNNLNNDEIIVGQILKINKGEIIRLFLYY